MAEDIKKKLNIRKVSVGNFLLLVLAMLVIVIINVIAKSMNGTAGSIRGSIGFTDIARADTPIEGSCVDSSCGSDCAEGDSSGCSGGGEGGGGEGY